MAKKKILVAEDDSFQAELIKSQIEEAGFDVSVQSNGEEAVTAIEKEAPDLLVLDILMPREDGYYVLKYYKEEGHTFPVIVFSNLAAEIEESKCKDFGIAEFITKSDLDVEELPNIIKKHLRRRRQEQQSGIVKIESPINISNLKLICVHCNKPTRVGFTFLKINGKNNESIIKLPSTMDTHC